MKSPVSKEYAGTNHLLNPARVYVTAAATDVRATIARIRAEQGVTQPKKANVTRIRGK